MSEWHRLGEAYYRRTVLYDLTWSISNLDGFMLAMSADAGLIALTRDPHQLVAVSDSSIDHNIHIYTGAGQLFEVVRWDVTARIVAIGFTWHDELVVVSDDGQARLYTWLVPTYQQDTPCLEATPTSYYYAYALGDDAAEYGIARALIQPHRLWALLRNGMVVEASFSHTDVWPEEMPTLDVQVVPPLCTPRPRLCAWAPMHHQVLLCTDTGAWKLDQHHSYASVSAAQSMQGASFSLNGKYVAWLDEHQQLHVDTADFSRRLRTYDIRTSQAYQAAPMALRAAPLLDDDSLFGQVSDKGGLGGSGVYCMTWCKDNAVALAMYEHVLLLGPYDEPLVFHVRGIPHIYSSADGLHIVHIDAHEHMALAEAPTLAALRPGSTNSAAILLDASRMAQQQNPHAYEAVRAIQDSLSEAVQACIEAATFEWQAPTQQTLIQAALFGRTFLDAYDPARMLQVSHMCRVLHAVRSPSIGIPAAYDESMPLILYRLASRNQHKLAVQICTFLGIRADPVLKHWARAKVARAHPTRGNEQLAHVIMDKFQAAGAVNYASIARCAWQAGHPRIATTLLECEVRAREQIPLLLRMQEHRLALRKAVESGDTDLVYQVLFALQRTLARGALFRTVQSLIWTELPPSPWAMGLCPPATPTYTDLASHLLVSYARDQDPGMLHDFLYQDDRHADMALLCMDEARRMDAPLRAEVLRRAQCHFDEDRACAWPARLTGEACSLLGIQAAIKSEGGGDLEGASLYDTILACLENPALEHRAEKLKHTFSVPNSRYYGLRVRTYVKMRNIEALLRLVSSHKPPHGYVFIVRALIQADLVDAACTFVGKGASDKASKHRLLTYIERGPHTPAIRAALQGALP